MSPLLLIAYITVVLEVPLLLAGLGSLSYANRILTLSRVNRTGESVQIPNNRAPAEGVTDVS
jgi:hypothetical protein